MFAKLTDLFVLLLAMSVLGCGHYPPSVDSKQDILRLPVSEQSIRARWLADNDIPSLTRFRELRSLDFSSGNAVKEAKITDVGLQKLAKLDLPHLENLVLGWCEKITDKGLKHVSQMDSVTWLGLPACPRITDAGLPALLQMKNLTGLDLRGCPGITDAGLNTLARKKNWETIVLGGCPNITAKGVAQLQRALPEANVEKNDVDWSYLQEK